jgi:hypothetical protein
MEITCACLNFSTAAPSLKSTSVSETLSIPYLDLDLGEIDILPSPDEIGPRADTKPVAENPEPDDSCVWIKEF